MSRVRPGQLRQLRAGERVALILVLERDPSLGTWWNCLEWDHFSWSSGCGETVLRNTAWFSHTILVSEPGEPP